MIHRTTVSFGLEIHKVGIDRVRDGLHRHDTKQDLVAGRFEIKPAAT